MQIVIRPAAAADIEDAFLWYEQQRPGLGSEFLSTVDDALQVIQRAPQRHPVIHRNTRRALLPRFPYDVYYRTYSDGGQLAQVGRRLLQNGSARFVRHMQPNSALVNDACAAPVISTAARHSPAVAVPRC